MNVRTSLSGAGAKRTTATFKKFIGGFSGWDKIEDTYNNGCHDADDQEIFLVLFKTMGRIMECADLKLSNIDLDKDPNQIYIHGMKLEKQKEIIYLTDDEGNPLIENGRRKFSFESIEGFRNFYIPKFEPLNNVFVEMIKEKKDYMLDYNKKNKTNYTDAYLLQNSNNSDGGKWKYHQMYYKICKIGVPAEGFGGNGWNKRKGEWWAHRIRSERACSVLLDWGYDLVKLQKFGGWTSSDMPQQYIDVSPEQIKVEKAPDVWTR